MTGTWFRPAVASRWLLISLAVAGLVVRCSPEMRDDLKELSRLSGLAKDFFKAEDVNVNLVNDRLLVVSLVNCAAGGLPDPERKYAAHEVALWTKANYRSIAKVQTISVVFVERHSLLIFSVTSSQQYAFAVRDLGRIPAPSE